ncbi:hypothetical protein Vafri_734, partial [Volvox africanus]
AGHRDHLQVRSSIARNKSTLSQRWPFVSAMSVQHIKVLYWSPLIKMASTSFHEHICGAQPVFVQGEAGTSEVIFARGCSDQAVFFFEGDQILDEDTRDLLGSELWSPESHLATLQSQAGSETSVFVGRQDVKPTWKNDALAL